MQVGQALRVVLPPVPERERRVAADLEAERAVEEHARRVQRRRLEEQDEERRAAVATAKPTKKRSRDARGARASG